MVSSPATRARRAFTLIELLVVIAIIAILIALLVPAVQKVRAAAARTQCVNNLKQIGLAMHMYQDTNRKLPTGWVTSKSAQPSPGWSWSLIILPYIDQAPLFTTINADVTTPGGAPGTPTAILTTVLAVYQCPSDSGPALNNFFNGYSKNNYVVNRWVTGPDANSQPAPMAVQTIPDGSSNTLLVGERDLTVNVAGTTFVRHNNTSASFEGRVGRGLNPQPAAGTTFNTGSEQRLAFNSQHSGGCNFLIADGSVHFISSSVDADPNDAYTNFPTVNSVNFTLQRLQIPNDGQPVQVPD